MPLAITDDHRSLGQVVRSFVDSNSVRASARTALSAAPDLSAIWARIAAQGWLGLHVPEQYGGSGYGLAELAVVLEELGRAVAPGPFLPTVVASALIHRAAYDEQRSRILPALVDGRRPAANGFSGMPVIDTAC